MTFHSDVRGGRNLMRAVEDLANAVRDHESRRYLQEAIAAYQVGAIRAAIVATWIAVAYDLIGKIRELADGSDGAANDFIRRLNQAIDGKNARQLLQIEEDLLRVSQETFEFIEHRERVALERLREDRHVCAHPAFVSSREVFVPTPELVRAHIATAVDAVPSKGPAPDKRAVQRFEVEILRESFPEALDDLAPYLRDRYFEPGKSSLRRGLAEFIVKGCLGMNSVDSHVTRRYALSAHALERIRPELLAEALTSAVTKREEGSGLTEDQLLCFTGNLGDMQLAWQALPSSSHVRIHTMLTSVPVQQLVDHQVFARNLVGEARKIVDGRLRDLDSQQLAEVIGQSSDLLYVDAAIAALRESSTYREAEGRMDTLILPLAPEMTADHVRQVLTCVRDNT
jgi:hypothetical protein